MRPVGVNRSGPTLGIPLDTGAHCFVPDRPPDSPFDLGDYRDDPQGFATACHNGRLFRTFSHRREKRFRIFFGPHLGPLPQPDHNILWSPGRNCQGKGGGCAAPRLNRLDTFLPSARFTAVVTKQSPKDAADRPRSAETRTLFIEQGAPEQLADLDSLSARLRTLIYRLDPSGRTHRLSSCGRFRQLSVGRAGSRCVRSVTRDIFVSPCP